MTRAAKGIRMNFCGYRFTLALVTALTTLAFGLFFLFGFDGGVGIQAILWLVIGVGIWLQSRFFRYVGAAWAGISVGVVVWRLLSSQNFEGYTFIWIVLFGFLCAVILYNLLFSKRFSNEFVQELALQPAYKKTVWTVFVVGLATAAVIATLNDIYNLSTSAN